MPEIAPDLSNRNRCVSVHWSLPAQCELPPSHWDDHETTHPESGVRLRYCRTGGAWRTEEWRDSFWHRIEIPPPGGYCGQPDPDRPGVTCTAQYGHRFSRSHSRDIDSEWHQWPTHVREPEHRPGLQEQDLLRGLLYDQAAELAELRATIAAYQKAGGATRFRSTPEAGERQSRLLTRVENHNCPVTTGIAAKIYLSWGWKGLTERTVRSDLASLARAGHLKVDESDPGCRRYAPVRSPRRRGESR
ncbi:hypothetical protein [Streptomyces sp. NPDC088794]|uniref:hypothetical protein n=1 Tax=Streptomyces sp. NPDC088794 TaxID=3365902 RepID=UPI00382EF6D8